MDFKSFILLVIIPMFGLSTVWATPSSNPVPPISMAIEIGAPQEVGFHNTPIPKAIKSINLSKNSSVGVYIKNPDDQKSFQINAIKARIQSARGKKSTVKLHLYEFSSEDQTVSEDLLNDQYAATVDENGEIRTFPIEEDISLKGSGILVVLQWTEGAPVQVPAGETAELKSNVNYNIPNPGNIGKGTKAAQILKHQVLDTQHPLTIGLVIE